MTHLRMQLLMSFVGGLMLGIATLHLWPHSTELASPTLAGAVGLLGIMTMFLLLRVFHVHVHFVPGAPNPIPNSGLADSSTSDHIHHEHCKDDAFSPERSQPANNEQLSTESNPNGIQNNAPSTACSHHIHSHEKASDGGLSWGWLGMVFGLGLHTLIDGVALAASVRSEWHGDWLSLAGMGTFLAVALHKPLDSFAIISVMKRDGWSPGQQTLVSFLFALACPIGAALFYLGADWFGGGNALLGAGLALSAGFFICIALSDLLPEVAFHDHDRTKLTIALMMGVALAVGVELAHQGPHNHAGHNHAGHNHAGHNHAEHNHAEHNHNPHHEDSDESHEHSDHGHEH